VNLRPGLLGIAVRVSQRQNLDKWLAHSQLVEIVFDDRELTAAASGQR
jgi:hypothetical protein